jgi:hypothetical protein
MEMSAERVRGSWSKLGLAMSEGVNLVPENE